jgi:chemotaxis signal transduction protein
MPAGDEATAATLRRRAELLAQPITAALPETGTIRVLTFSRGGRLAVDVEAVREVAPLPKVEPLPGQPLFLAGLVAWRGRPIIAIEPAALLGINPTAEATHLIVLGGAHGEVALLADDVQGVVSVRRDDLGQPSTGPVGLDRLAAGYHQTIGLLLDAGLLEASLLEFSQPKEVRP